MDFQAYDIALIPVIVAVIQLFITAGLPKRFAPVVSLALGEVAAFVYVAPGDPAQAALVGVVMGLSAVGLFSGVKNTIQLINPPQTPNNDKSIGQ
jgi:hypothetical protein